MQPRELAALPPQARRLVHAVDRLRDQHADADPARRAELWARAHQACDGLWNRHLTWRDHLAYQTRRIAARVRRTFHRPNMR